MKASAGSYRLRRTTGIAIATIGFAILFGAAASAQWWPSNGQNGWWSNQSGTSSQQQYQRTQRQPAQRAASQQQQQQQQQYYQYQQQGQYPSSSYYQPYYPSNQPQAGYPYVSPAGRSPPVMAYGPPSARRGESKRDESAMPADANAAPAGPETAYCVRLCDGRFFPLASEARITPAKLCSALCPASPTKVYEGTNIDDAQSSDGASYPKLANAHRYRKELVDGCTCNGKDAFGLAKVDLAKDPTLQSGDIVATAEGLQVVSGSRGSARDRTARFTPIKKSSLVSRSLRRSLRDVAIAKSVEQD